MQGTFTPQAERQPPVEWHARLMDRMPGAAVWLKSIVDRVVDPKGFAGHLGKLIETIQFHRAGGEASRAVLTRQENNAFQLDVFLIPDAWEEMEAFARVPRWTDPDTADCVRHYGLAAGLRSIFGCTVIFADCGED